MSDPYILLISLSERMLLVFQRNVEVMSSSDAALTRLENFYISNAKSVPSLYYDRVATI